MKSVVAGLVMLASAAVRGRGTTLEEAARQMTGDEAVKGTAALTTTKEARDIGGVFPPRSGGDDDADQEGAAASHATPGPGEWEVACQLRSGSDLMFDRRSLREFGAMTLVRWAAPDDPRAEDQIYTALVNCHEKTIEATWPGKRSDTRVGTCGRRLVEAVCDARTARKGIRPARGFSPDSPGGRRGGAAPPADR